MNAGGREISLRTCLLFIILLVICLLMFATLVHHGFVYRPPPPACPNEAGRIERDFVNKNWKMLYSGAKHRQQDLVNSTMLSAAASSDITVVTAYYPLPNLRKRSVDTFGKHIRNFLSLKRVPLVVYTDSDKTISAVREYRPPATDPLIRLEKRPFNSWPMMSPEMMKFWNKTAELDPDRQWFLPEIYAVWASKIDFVLDAARMNPFNRSSSSKWWIWCDFGIMREPAHMHFYQNFPFAAPQILVPGRIHFLEVDLIPQRFADQFHRREKRVKLPLPWKTLGGGVIAGDLDAWTDFRAGYRQALVDLDRRRMFTGDDQVVLFTMLVERRTRKPFRLFHSPDPAAQDVVSDRWMVFLRYLAGDVVPVVDSRWEE